MKFFSINTPELNMDLNLLDLDSCQASIELPDGSLLTVSKKGSDIYTVREKVELGNELTSIMKK